MNIVMILGVLAIFTLFGGCKKAKERRAQTAELRKGQYSFINPLLDCYDFEESSLASMKKLEKQIESFIDSEIKAGNISHCSVYYRDLNNGPWIGVNEDEEYAPASLLKVPFMIAALRQTEIDPGFIRKSVIYYPQRSELEQHIVDSTFRLTPGQSYTMEELVNYMIIYSDNDAKDLLLANLPLTTFNSVFYDLGIEIEKFGVEDNFLSVKDYSTYFRLLYNATYLSRNMSNVALQILAGSTYKKGIAAGVPAGVVVSHKFGERTIQNSPEIQLHECGIVYKENSPYILCVMVRGVDFDKNASVIRNISKITWEAAGK